MSNHHVLIQGCCSESDLGTATLCGQRLSTGHSLNILNEQIIPVMSFSSLMKMTIPGFIGLKLGKSGTVVQMGIIFEHRLEALESKPQSHKESLGCAGEGFGQWFNLIILVKNE